MKTILKISLFIIILGCIIISPTESFAHQTQGDSISGSPKKSTIGSSIVSVETTAQEVRNGNEGQGFIGVVDTILGFIQIMAGLLSVVIIAVTGFRYITETPDVKNEIKKSMMPIVVGMLLVFFAVTIAKFLIGVFEQ